MTKESTKVVPAASENQSTSGSDAASFIRANNTTTVKDTRTTISMTQGQYTDYLGTHGIEKAVIKTIDKAERALISGAITVGSEQLASDIKAAKKAGDTGTDLSVEVRIARPTGAYKVESTAEKTVRNIATGESSPRFGTVRVTSRVKTLLDKEAVATASEVVRAALQKK